MYKVEINISDWLLNENQKVVIECDDFNKVQIIQEFIEFQQEHGWAADYEAVSIDDEYDDEDYDAEEDEAEENEEEQTEENEEAEYKVGDIVEDEDGLVWELVE